MNIEPYTCRFRLDRPLGADDLTVRTGEVFRLLQRVSVEEICAVLDKYENRWLRAFPVYFAMLDDREVWLWPMPGEVYEIERVLR